MNKPSRSAATCRPRYPRRHRRRQSCYRDAVLRRTDFRSLRSLAVQSAKARPRLYADFNFKVLFKDGDALITRARASLISQFLDDPSATHLLFIDADIGFEPDQVLRLIECGADMCAAIYPIKRIDWDKVKSDDRNRSPQSGSGGAEICV